MVDYRFSLLSSIKDEYISLADFLNDSNMDIDEFYIEFDRLNDMIEDLNYDKVSLIENSINVPNTFKERWLDIYIGKINQIEFLSESQRQFMIYLMAFMNKEELSVFHFQNLLEVS